MIGRAFLIVKTTGLVSIIISNKKKLNVHVFCMTGKRRVTGNLIYMQSVNSSRNTDKKLAKTVEIVRIIRKWGNCFFVAKNKNGELNNLNKWQYTYKFNSAGFMAFVIHTTERHWPG